MFGLVYLLSSWVVGFVFIKKFLPILFKQSILKTLSGKQAKLDNFMVTVPAAFLIGTLLITWLTYIVSFFFRECQAPLFYGNLLSISLFSAISILYITIKRKTLLKFLKPLRNPNNNILINLLKDRKIEIVLVSVVIIVSSFIMFHTFSISNNNMYIGSSVWSDFGPHLSLIRSFSEGSNFPTIYPHFAADGIKYHFMFQFLAGNLEYLGLRIDWAFNIPSIFSFASLIILLYSFATILTGSRLVGLLTVFLFFFRSSFAIYYFIKNNLPYGFSNIIKSILTNDLHIGHTANEVWGLWAQNVYVNQRHFAFSLSVMILILIITFPMYRKMNDSLVKLKIKIKRSKISFADRIKSIFKEIFFTKDSWSTNKPVHAIFAGIILGLIGFWNGAVVIATILILISLSMLSKHRLNYLIVVIIALSLAYLQTKIFIGGDGSAIKPEILIGFLANKKDFGGIIIYLLELLGILPLLVVLSIFIVPKGMRWIMLAFVTPAIMAFTISFTPDINVNHKFVLISVMLLNISVAYLIYRLFMIKHIVTYILAALSVLVMTATGYVDIITLYNMNTKSKSIVIGSNDSTTDWISKNTGKKDIFLTAPQVLNSVLLSGRSIYYGWPYYAWSAGYETEPREYIAKQIYSTTDKAALEKLVKDNNIRYIVIEPENRSSDYIPILNEEFIKYSYQLVYRNDKKDINIYRTY